MFWRSLILFLTISEQYTEFHFLYILTWMSFKSILYVWSENIWESALSFSVGPRDQTQAVRPSSKQLCTISQLTLLALFVTFENNCRGWTDGSDIKNTWCYTNIFNSSFRRLDTLFWLAWAPGMHMMHRHIWGQNTHKQQIRKNFKSKTTKNNYSFLLLYSDTSFYYILNYSALIHIFQEKEESNHLARSRHYFLSHNLRSSLKRSFS